MLGKAMFTIVESTNSMNTPSEAIARTVEGFTALRVTRACAARARDVRVVPKGAGAVSSYVIAADPLRCRAGSRRPRGGSSASPRGLRAGSAAVAQVALERLLDLEH